MKNEIIRIGQIGIRFLLEAAETNGSVAMCAISFLPANPTLNSNGAAEVCLKVSAGPGCRFPFGLPITDSDKGHVCFFGTSARPCPQRFGQQFHRHV
jgi:hypothetical protein